MSGPFESDHAYSVQLQAAKGTEILPYRRGGNLNAQRNGTTTTLGEAVA
jgi:hypothetical protein